MGDENNSNIFIDEKKEQPAISGPNNRAVCVAIPISGGRPSRLIGDSPYDFIPLLKDSSAAWINFPVKDIHKDAEIIAMSLGFSSSLVPTVISNHLSAYEDIDT